MSNFQNTNAFFDLLVEDVSSEDEFKMLRDHGNMLSRNGHPAATARDPRITTETYKTRWLQPHQLRRFMVTTMI